MFPDFPVLFSNVSEYKTSVQAHVYGYNKGLWGISANTNRYTHLLHTALCSHVHLKQHRNLFDGYQKQRHNYDSYILAIMEKRITPQSLYVCGPFKISHNTFSNFMVNIRISMQWQHFCIFRGLTVFACLSVKDITNH